MNKLLLVEDDPVQQGILVECLQQEGYAIDTARNEEEAVACLHADAYELVITDMLMNAADGGLKVVREAKRLDSLTQVIVLTAYGELKSAVACMEQGAFTYLEKQGEGETYEVLKHKARLAIEHRKALRQAVRLIGFAGAVSAAIELNDPYTAGHSKRVAELTRLMAAEIGLSSDQQEDAWMAAALHDIGKLCVDPKILNKTLHLDKGEYAKIRSHPTVGREMLENVPELTALLQAIHQHHERYDGDTGRNEQPGYPGHVSGDAIDVIAQLIAVADTFDALTSDRSYRISTDDPGCVTDAKNQIRIDEGGKFHPDAVDAFFRLDKKGKIDNILAMGPRVKGRGEPMS